ncbi:hypothetical protein [Merismopedia glauca]|uniref:Uncharacterized protein n=1 Tax=Merismopedia glauca CCAP 1448/3 TaxID=1296344 RepID=A0A2T1BZL0_9CYAN|nr:hypothetical protein [Merismopedia glauca]PSB01348.1 hypothetical protein C7B64_18775 [Merismopedia glauca CCAP 1448/3]
MLEAKLSPCASLLYQWVLLRVPTDNKLKIDLQDFQAWTGEFREKSYSYTEVFEALGQLRELNLVNVSRTEVTLEAKVSNRFCICSETELPSETFPGKDRPNRWLLFTKILVVSSILSFASISIGLTLFKLQPEAINTPNPWSVLGEKNQ